MTSQSRARGATLPGVVMGVGGFGVSLCVVRASSVALGPVALRATGPFADDSAARPYPEGS